MKMTIVALLISGGIFFFSVGTIGILRFKDTFERAHAAAKCDTLGAVLSLLALVVHEGITSASVKLLIVIFFLWMTNPTATHIISRAEYRRRGMEKSVGGVDRDEII
ncbi:multisubunit sodium/proton antiporter, MrpG subunit [Peptoclostridium litorale DSM 5388]|uniref:Monovalent cation/proton antiporter, MnhG/PhaG subunit n=1 Tax=Peptoclostridium litorale DSM 5388 TaxID=1121324 RepID=A0A069RJK4_PEPLI|nr:monovalent cation/H(+) antiporter subunit G [Peptoclostridium litorale]KDR94432.1 hypothetical protein CLIT_20c00770 [Peptoclostridium litorale DSM 5388]SIO23997.1 multisubunit sodium/proton antiporter, MrpG subunit [Peptoclostridium litorale DSM 5388]